MYVTRLDEETNFYAPYSVQIWSPEPSIETIIAGVDERVERRKDEIKLTKRSRSRNEITPLIRMNTARTDACALVSCLFFASERWLQYYNTLAFYYPIFKEDPTFVHNKETIATIFEEYCFFQNALNHNQHHEIVACGPMIEGRLNMLQAHEIAMQSYALPV